MPEVVVVGAGPVGTLLAAELARRNVDVLLIERRDGAAAGTRAIGVHAPVLAALEPSGVTDALLAEARRVSVGEARSGGRTLGTVRFDVLSRRFPFVATLPQPATLRALAHGAPAPVHGTVTRLRASADAVTVSVQRPTGHDELSAPLVVNAGGPRARGLVFGDREVRTRAVPDRYVMADVPAPGTDAAVVHLDPQGVLESFPLPAGVRRFVAPAPHDAPDDPTVSGEILREALRARGEEDAAASVGDAGWFAIRRTMVPRMRRGRILTIGDAAHEISPMGGQGMNLGLLDAVTLAPILADWVRAGEPPTAELAAWERRRSRSARVAGVIASMNTMLGRPASPGTDALRRRMLSVGLASPLATLFAHAYAMGFDADAGRGGAPGRGRRHPGTALPETTS